MLFGKNAREDYVALNYLHSQIMMHTGEPWGQRDEQLTRAAVTRPFRTAFGQELYGDIYQKAAALLDSIVNRVVFRDGNKRTALVAAALYLGRNDQIMHINPKEGEAFMWHVVMNHPDISEIAAWLREHTIRKQLLVDLSNI